VARLSATNGRPTSAFCRLNTLKEMHWMRWAWSVTAADECFSRTLTSLRNFSTTLRSRNKLSLVYSVFHRRLWFSLLRQFHKVLPCELDVSQCVAVWTWCFITCCRVNLMFHNVLPCELDVSQRVTVWIRCFTTCCRLSVNVNMWVETRTVSLSL